MRDFDKNLKIIKIDWKGRCKVDFFFITIEN